MSFVKALVGALITSMLTIGVVAAQDYPSRPIKIVVPYAAGGTSDIMARKMGQLLNQAWGQPVIIENKPGASMIVGSETVAKAPPDGYTLLLASNPHAINPGLYPNLPYDSEKSFTPITNMAVSPLIVVVHPSVPARTLAELIALAKAKPGEITYGSAAFGGVAHLAVELFSLRSGIKLQHVPYRGAGPALNDLLAGHISVMFNALPPTIPQVEEGKLAALALGTTKRSKSLPDLSTIAELGFPGFDASTWVGIMAPAKTPPAIVQKLSAEISKQLDDPAMIAWMKTQGLEKIGSTPEQFAQALRDETAQWRKVIEETGVKVP